MKSLKVGCVEMLLMRLAYGIILYVVTAFIVILTTNTQMVVVWDAMLVFVALYLFALALVCVRESSGETFNATFFSFVECWQGIFSKCVCIFSFFALIVTTISVTMLFKTIFSQVFALDFKDAHCVVEESMRYADIYTSVRVRVVDSAAAAPKGVTACACVSDYKYASLQETGAFHPMPCQFSVQTFTVNETTGETFKAVQIAPWVCSDVSQLALDAWAARGEPVACKIAVRGGDEVAAARNTRCPPRDDAFYVATFDESIYYGHNVLKTVVYASYVPTLLAGVFLTLYIAEGYLNARIVCLEIDQQSWCPTLMKIFRQMQEKYLPCLRAEDLYAVSQAQEHHHDQQDGPPGGHGA